MTKELKAIRTAIANFIKSEGCDCCEGDDHEEHKAIIGKLLKVPKYSDGSGYDFREFESK